MQTKIQNFLNEGCLRCNLGGTKACKVVYWQKEVALLMAIFAQSGLEPRMKWGVPVYTFKGENIVSVSALKSAAVLGFFNGALIADKYQLLKKQGEIVASRIMTFTSTDEILAQKSILQEYLNYATTIALSGEKIPRTASAINFPTELLEIFKTDHVYQKAFERLTPGRQRGYCLYFSKPKKESTRIQRILKCRMQIFDGVGLHDQYNAKN